MGAALTADNSILKLAEGLHRLYGAEASQLLRQFAAQNAKAGDAQSAAYWNNIALVIANSNPLQSHSTGERAP